MLCSSPMSTSTSRTTGSRALAAATYIPHWCIRTARPSVLMVAVLPPMFGPVMSRSFVSPSARSFATGFSIRGWRTSRRSYEPSSTCSGRFRRQSRASRAFAAIRSSSPITASVIGTAASEASRPDSSVRMRRTSASSSRIRRVSSLFSCVTAAGSTKYVCPVADASTMMPCTCPTRLACTGST